MNQTKRRRKCEQSEGEEQAGPSGRSCQPVNPATSLLQELTTYKDRLAQRRRWWWQKHLIRWKHFSHQLVIHRGRFSLLTNLNLTYESLRGEKSSNTSGMNQVHNHNPHPLILTGNRWQSKEVRLWLPWVLSSVMILDFDHEVLMLHPIKYDHR